MTLPQADLPRPDVDEGVDDETIDLYFKYLNYSDTAAPSDESSTREAAAKYIRENVGAQRYTKELKVMLDEYGEDVLLATARHAAIAVQTRLQDVGVSPELHTRFTKSTSWFLWHAAKERYLSKHPEIQSKMDNANEYQPHDPLLHLKTGVSTDKAQQSYRAHEEIITTHFGWELYDKGSTILHPDPFVSADTLLEAHAPQAAKDSVRSLLSTPHKPNFTLSAFQLRELGSTVWNYGRRNIPLPQQ